MKANRNKKEPVHGQTLELIQTAGEAIPPGDHTGRNQLETILDELHRIRLKLDYALAQVDGKSSSNLVQ